MWTFDSLNGICSATAQTYLGRTSADACVLQEIRLRAPGCCQAERSASLGGRALSVGPAKDTAASRTSAGVAVAVRLHFGMALPLFQLAPEVEHSRVIIRWLGAVWRVGFHLVSLYLYDGEGLFRGNLDLLQAIGGTIDEIQGPWILASDVNFTPDPLLPEDPA